ncbi:MAG: nickel pincer cofactor biosynthesis protein LarB [Candidatus Hydrogenedentota bacterium]
MNTDKIFELLKKYKENKLTDKEFVNELGLLPYQDIGFAKLDIHREIRCGIPEAVYGNHKSLTELIKIITRLKKEKKRILLTRLDSFKYKKLKKRFAFLSGIKANERNILYSKSKKIINNLLPVIITAGTSDIPVAKECSATLKVMGYNPLEIFDIGVAGIHRLFDNLNKIRMGDVVIAVAGMDGVLPTIVANLVKAPVIGVPTSTGYGTALNGFSALLTMLNSCSGKLAVCNIDNGFQAGCIAISILNKIEDRRQKLKRYKD